MKISVVVPTYNRQNLLRNNIEALLKQDYDQSKYEVLICDDGSSDGTEEMMKEYLSQKKSAQIKYLRQKNQGPAAARNLGIKNASGDIIAFTDDDCEADAIWLYEIAKSFRANPEIIGVGGVTYSIPTKITPFTHQIENKETWSFPTCNIAYTKKILDKLDGFDPRFPFTNEDADISWRIESSGKVIHNPNMKILHPPRPSSFMKELRSIRFLGSEFILQKKMPEEYRRRKGSPYREILYVHGLKIFAKKLVKHRKWITKDPLVYLEFAAMLILQRLYLYLWLMPKWLIENS
jgi:glycosyltransferase involved in cell wall biosynthesis